MPLSEYDSKEALRAATDWLVASELPGSAAAREGIADTIPLAMMGMVEPDDLDDVAAIVEKHGWLVHDAATPEDVQRAQLKEAVKASFDYVRCLRAMPRCGFGNQKFSKLCDDSYEPGQGAAFLLNLTYVRSAWISAAYSTGNA